MIIVCGLNMNKHMFCEMSVYCCEVWFIKKKKEQKEIRNPHHQVHLVLFWIFQTSFHEDSCYLCDDIFCKQIDYLS